MTPRARSIVDFIEAGIVDPTKVVRVALQNAASVAGLLITTEAMITDRPKKDAGAGDAGRRRHGRRHGRHGLLSPGILPISKAKGPEQSGPFLFAQSSIQYRR